MFNDARRSFIIICTGVILAILLTLIFMLNYSLYLQSNRELGIIFGLISEQGMNLPSFETEEEESAIPISSAILSQLRFYIAVFSADKKLISQNSENFQRMSPDEAKKYALDIIEIGNEEGHFELEGRYYKYRLEEREGAHQVIILDASVYRIRSTEYRDLSIVLFASSFLICVVIVAMVSGRATKPFRDNYEKQKRFITNAGHELNTPIAIISANNDIQEGIFGETEWTRGTREQIGRLNDLITNLIKLARLEERSPDIILTKVDLSAVAKRTTDNFKNIVLNSNKSYNIDIEDGVIVKAEERGLEELINILLDNANKYCDSGGRISVKLEKIAYFNNARLTVSNDYEAGKGTDFSRFFERFYRNDISHNNKEQSGYGIGLSVAERLVRIFNAKINVNYADGVISFIVSF